MGVYSVMVRNMRIHTKMAKKLNVLQSTRKSLGLVSWCDCESLSAVRLTHERELFGGRVGAGSLGGEPVMRAERVRGRCGPRRSRRPRDRSSAVRAVRPFELVGMRDGAVCGGVWGRRSYRSRPVAR